MTTLSNIELSDITRERIKTIDIYISDNESAFADICITHNEIFYCLGTEDMREDGHISISDREFNHLYRGIINALKNSDCCCKHRTDLIRFKMAITLIDAEKISHNQASIVPHSITMIIECLSNECEEFIFLEGFKSLLP